MIPQKIGYRKSDEQRAEEGLQDLFSDIRTWWNSTKPKPKPDRTPTENSVVYGFITSVKIAFLVIAVYTIISILTNPYWILDSMYWFKGLF